MAEQELQVVRLRDDFYRDGFYKVILAFLTVMAAVVLLIVVSVFLFLLKPTPVQFVVGDEWRVLPPVSVEQPYLRTPDLLQWAGTILPTLFNYDFVNYKKELDTRTQYFTPNGWMKFLDVLNGFVNYNTVVNTKLFVSVSPLGAPFVLNQGLLQGRYAWWVQMPLNLNYISMDKSNPQAIQVQALVVRVPTLNNLDGVSIDNIVVTRT